MHSAIAVLAVGLVLACVASLTFIYRHQKARQAAVVKEGVQKPRE